MPSIKQETPGLISYRSVLAALASILLCLVSLAGCGSNAQKITDALTNAVADLSNAPAQFDAILTDTIARLEGLDKDVTGQVKDLLDNVSRQFEAATFCTADYFGRRSREGVEGLLHKVDPKGHNAPTLVPVICHTSPDDGVQAGATQQVIYTGYDLQDFSSVNPFTASLVYGDGTVAVANFGTINVTTNYQLSVEFQAFD